MGGIDEGDMKGGILQLLLPSFLPGMCFSINANEKCPPIK